MSDSKPYNVWNDKPRWCQPWSILLTGITIISGCWFFTRILWLTILIALPILIWWFVFLILYPQAMRKNHSDDAIKYSQ
jgi:uncharacterized membrane protein